MESKNITLNKDFISAHNLVDIYIKKAGFYKKGIKEWSSILMEVVKIYGKTSLNMHKKITLDAIIAGNKEYLPALQNMNMLFEICTEVISSATQIWNDEKENFSFTSNLQYTT